MLDFVDAPALYAVGVGGHIARTVDGEFRILRFITPSGEILNVALADDTVLEGVRTVAQDLQIAQIEAGEAIHDLGLFGDDPRNP